jgi:ribonucleoside-triphosphate reductase
MDIKITLDRNFTATFNKLRATHGDALAKLNGFSDEQLSYTDFIDNFVDHATVADASIDGNANVAHKDIVSMENEMSKPHSKLLGFNKIFYEIQKKYGFSTAVDWLTNEWDGHFYLHDAYNTTYKPYCFAYDIEDLVNRGLYFINDFNAQPPQHLITYTDFVSEFISWCCNRTSGAVGIPAFLVYSYYFWKRDVESGYCLVDPAYYRDQEFQRIIYKLNQPFLRGGIQSAFTNFSIFDRPYLEALFGGKEFPDGTFIIDYIDEILDYQKQFMMILSKTRVENMMTFPVMTYALLRKNGKFVDEEYAKWCCQHNMAWADSNFFISDDINSLSNCCRLKSNIKDLGYFNSIGGTALEVGSVKVNTINLARLAYENCEEDYLEALKAKTKLCLEALDCIRHIIQRNVDKGLLPNYSLGILNMESQYNTIGIIGIYEALQRYGYTRKDLFGYTYYTDDGVEFAKEILATIHEVKDAFRKDKDYMINIEQIPGERAAAILMEKDKLFYPNEVYELPLYGNQWIPLGVKTPIAEKVRLSATLDDACSGGSIAHINIDAPFNNFETAWNILNFVADAGVTYFAFNLRISACKHNHGFYGSTCPKCGEPKVTTYQRIVGFLTPERTYSKERKAEFQMRDWFSLNMKGEM